ncbi:MAG: hypothetical protein ACOYVK_15675 [Bacillota bacterium]
MAGFRTGIQRYVSGGSLPSTVAGARATFSIPTSSKLYDAGNVLYFLVNINANATWYGNYDAGIYRQNGKWYAFIMGNGNPSWNAVEISNMDGKTANIKLIPRKYTVAGTTYYDLDLFIDGTKKLSVQDFSGKYIKSIYEDVIAVTSAEINIVPANNDWTNFNNDRHSYILSGSFTNAYPVNRDGTDYTGGSYRVQKNCDTDYPSGKNYSNLVSSVCTIHSSGSRSMTSTVDIRKAGNVF